MEFLDEIPLLGDFRDIVAETKMARVPETWFVLLSDVQNSTQAIEQGKYREVNLVGAASIMALLNETGEKRVPYIFGGDGATFLLPAALLEKGKAALLATQKMALGSFGLQLRIGLVPVSRLLEAKKEIRVARYRTSDQVSQAALSGNGLVEAERWVKDKSGNNPFLVLGQKRESGNFEGLECRWEPVPSRKGEIVSLILYSPRENPGESAAVYRKMLAEIEKIYGPSASPVSEAGLKLALGISQYTKETAARYAALSGWKRCVKTFQTFALTHLFSIAWRTIARKAGKKYKKELIENTDFKKFDGMLRMVLDGNAEQRKALEALLQKASQAGDVVYGIHCSTQALMTCLIFDRSQGNHLHFIDGDQGGYAEAAKQLKQSLKNQSSNSLAKTGTRL